MMQPSSLNRSSPVATSLPFKGGALFSHTEIRDVMKPQTYCKVCVSTAYRDQRYHETVNKVCVCVDCTLVNMEGDQRCGKTEKMSYC